MGKLFAGCVALALVIALDAPEFAATETVKGKIVDQTCYLKDKTNTANNHKMPEETADCAVGCAKQGAPLALLTEDGKLYQITGGLAADMNAKLIPHIAHTVEITGDVTEKDGKPTLVKPDHVNLGLAIDLVKPNGERQLVVAAIKKAETLTFFEFWQAYEDIVRRARDNKLTMDDFTGVTASLTNPGGIGTVHSVPRLMPGQSMIMGVGSMDYPAEFQGTSQDALNKMGVSKVMTLTSTYDHRVIQGAASGEFLRVMSQLLLGENEFFDEIFKSLRIPYEPVRWLKDIDASHDDDVTKAARVFELIHSYRVRGHVMADTDPLEYRQRKHPDLDITEHGLTLWDLEREFAVGGFAGQSMM